MIKRRSVLIAAATAALWPVLPAAAAPARPSIRPRSDWAEGRDPRGSLKREDDVRFLLIHHTATANDYAAGEVADELRSVFAFHTSEEKGWPDVAYNFFVDRFGTIWEGRSGSIDGPVRGDATGGSQGYAQLCCFLGDFTEEVPTSAAMTAMVGLLAWLAARDGVDLGAEVSFISRGSSRWPEGSRVRTTAVAGHRDMSLTECPGDGLYPLLASDLAPRARAILARTPSTPTSASTSPRASTSASGSAAPSPSAAPSTPPVWADGVGITASVAAMVGGGVLMWRGRPTSEKQSRDDGEQPDDEGGGEADEEATQGL